MYLNKIKHTKIGAVTKQDLYLSKRYIFVSLVTDVDTKRNANGM